MASDEAEKLLKQIDVLSSLIHSHKQLKDKEKDRENCSRSDKNTKTFFKKATRNTPTNKNSINSSNFNLDRRKQRFVKHDTATTSGSSSSCKTTLESHKDCTIPTVASQNSATKIAKQIPSENPGFSSEFRYTSKTSQNNTANSTKSSNIKTTKEKNMEAALLSARLSSLSSSIASAKSKLQANSNARLQSAHSSSGPLIKSNVTAKPSLPSASRKAMKTSGVTSSTNTKPSTSLLDARMTKLTANIPSSSSLSVSATKVDSTTPSKNTVESTKNQLKIQPSSFQASHSGSNSSTTCISSKQELQNNSSMSWKRKGTASSNNISRSSTTLKKTSKKSDSSKNQSKPSVFKWNKDCDTQTANITTASIPAAKSTLKWSKKEIPKQKSLSNTSSVLPVKSKHIWRAKGSLTIDRRKSTGTRSPSGFMKRRQRTIKKTLSKKTTPSRYHFVKSKRRASLSEKSGQATSTQGESSKSTIDTKTTSKKAKQKSSKLLNISGSKYIMDASRKTLRRVSKDDNQASSTVGTKRRSSLTKVVLGGVTFTETSPGVLVRSMSARRSLASQLRQRSVQNALLYKYKKKAKSSQYCMFYNRFGKCNKGNNCPYIHDSSKVAVCTRFIQGLCDKTDGSCPFSHHIDQDKMPVCQFFLQDKCTNEDCPYSHVNVSSNAAVCQDFVKGYCPLGKKCKKKHIVDCEEYQRTGKCSRGKKCNLMHRKQKVRRRKRKSSKDMTQSVDEVKKPKIIMTEEEGFLPLNTTEESSEKLVNETREDVGSRERVKTIAIKPRFLISKEEKG